MESFAVDRNLYEVNDVWENDDFDSISMGDSFTGDPDWTGLLDHAPAVILNDRMITDALHSPRTLTSSTDHSYSLVANECEMNTDESHDDEPRGSLDDFDKDLESECFPAIPMCAASSSTNGVYIKQEPISAPSSPQPHRKSQSLLKQPTIILATRPNRNNILPKVNIKVENSAGSPGFSLPPTPPSSTSSDSEGSLSPDHIHQPVSPPSSSSNGRQRSMTSNRSNNHASSSHSSLISSQPKGATGTLVLTEEEKRTLLAEGYPIPSRLPLSKAEEKSLKKIRRKIKNKISAQESRRKKKEYMDALEKKVEVLNSENTDYKKRVDSLENSNKSLLSQLHKLQALVGGVAAIRSSRNVATQTTAVMMVVLCFAMCVGCWGISHLAASSFTASPQGSSFAMTADSLAPPLCLSSSNDPYATPAKRSRLLLAFLDEWEPESMSFVPSFEATTSQVTSRDEKRSLQQNTSSTITTFHPTMKPLNTSA